MVGAKLLGVRLRPELRQARDPSTSLQEVGKAIDDGALDDPATLLPRCNC